MMKSVLKFAAWAVMAVCLLTACGSGGVDHSNPQSVADAALECYDMGDYVKLKTLLNPADEEALEECDNMIAMAEKAHEKYPDKVHEKKVRPFKNVTEEYTGAELSENSKSAVVQYEGDYPRLVILTKVDGKWYFERFK